MNANRALCFLLIFSFILAAIIGHALFLNHDNSWSLIVAQRVLENPEEWGLAAVPNPPLNGLIYIPAVLLEKITGLFVQDALVLYVLSIAALSLAGGYLSLPKERALRDTTLFAFLVLVPVGFLIGQREHIMLLLIWPYLCHRIKFIDSGASRYGLLLGFVSGWGFSIKLFSWLVPIFVELYVAWRTREHRIQPVHVGLAMAGFCYLAYTVLLTPDFLTQALPMLLNLYGGVNSSSALRVQSYSINGLILLIGSVLYWVNFNKDRYHDGYAVLVLAGIAFYLSALMQNKGWWYHFLPVHVISLMLASAHWVCWSRPVKLLSTFLITMLLLGVMINENVFMVIEYWQNKNNKHSQLIRAVAEVKGDSMFAFSAGLRYVLPTPQYTNMQWASRHPSLWWLPAYYGEFRINVKNEELLEIERQLKETVVEDFVTMMPAVVLVDTSRYKEHYGDEVFDYLEYFNGDMRFSKAWEDYKHVGRVNPFDIYSRIIE